MRVVAEQLGLAAATPHAIAAAVVALLIVLLAAAAGWAAGRVLGARLASYWERMSGAEASGIAPRACALVRYFVIWLILAVALRIEPWPLSAAFLLGLGAAFAVAMLVVHAARGLRLSRWIGILLGVFLFAAILANATGGLRPVSDALDAVAFSIGSRRLSLLSVIQILFALLALYAVVRVAMRLSGQVIGHSRSLDPTQRVLTQKLVAIGFVAIAVFVAIDLAGIDLTALAVFSGALGLAIGFGLQKTFGNLIAGIILLMDRSIKPGDVISVGESFGQVNKIGVRAVSIVTREGKEYLIPNELLMTQEVVNWSYSTRDVRISIPVRIAFDSDVALAQRLMIEAAVAAPRVLANPKPVAWMTGFGDSAIELEIRVWITDPEAGLGNVRSSILMKAWELFREHGVQVPYPQRDLRVKEWPAREAPPSR